MAYGYEKDIDYKKLMESAAKAGDLERAAIFEAQNNEKIAGEGLTVQPTKYYTQYLRPVTQSNPYQTELEKATARPQSSPYQTQQTEATARLQSTPYQAELERVTAAQSSGGTEALDGLLNGDAVAAYKKAYLREADRTMRDTLGQYATMTGGIPSTQAVTAASQAADYQKSQLAEKLPSLYQQQIEAAMSRWKQLGAADEKVAQILGVEVGAQTADQAYQAWSQKMQEDQFAWQKEQQARSDSYSLALTLLQSGQMPSDELLQAAGISSADAQKILSAAKTASYSGGGSYSSGSKLKTVGYEERQKLLDKVKKAGNISAAAADIAYYQAAGYDYNELYTWLLNYAGLGSRSGSYTGGYTGTAKAKQDLRGQPGTNTKPRNYFRDVTH